MLGISLSSPQFTSLRELPYAADNQYSPVVAGVAGALAHAGMRPRGGVGEALIIPA